MLGSAGRAVVRLLCGVLLGLCGAGQARAQGTVPQASISAELQTLAAAARTIFVGQIVSIQHRGSVVEVGFRVEQPVAGVVGATFTLREWAGMWAPGSQRYAVGQRVLAFMHGASGAGLSSPVHGAEGLVPVVVQGADAPKLLDVRRVAASVVRAPGTRLPDTTDGAVALDGVIGLISSQRASTFEPVRLPLPVRARPPVAFPGANRATKFQRGTVQTPGTDDSELPGSSELLKVRQ